MTIPNVVKKLEQARAALKRNAGTPVVTSENGPADLSLVDALVSALAAQAARIEALEKQVAQLERERR